MLTLSSYKPEYGKTIAGIAGLFLLFTNIGCGGNVELSTVDTESEVIADEMPSDPAKIDSPVFQEHLFTVENLTKELADDPNRPDLVFQLMLAKMELGDHQGALEMLEPLDDLGDESWGSQGHMLAGKIIRERLLPGSPEETRKELTEKAVKQYGIALELDASNLAAYWYLGDLQQGLGNIDEAKANFAFYLAIQPYAYDVRLRLAEIYFEEEAFEKAAFLLEEMKTDPNEERRLKALELLSKAETGAPDGPKWTYLWVIFLVIVLIPLVTILLRMITRVTNRKRLM